MEGKLPTMEIEGTQYEVDVSARELRQVGRPDKRLYFDQMLNHQTHYTLEYDRVQKKRANSLTLSYLADHSSARWPICSKRAGSLRSERTASATPCGSSG